METGKTQREPSTPQELLAFFKKRSPDLTSKLDKMYELFNQYRQNQTDSHQILELIRTADDALSKVSDGKVKLRDVQLMNVIMLSAFPEDGNTLAEIKTGEGKSNIVRVLAYVKAMLNPTKQVDVITTSDMLAKRDGGASEDQESKEAVAFFKALGLTLDHSIDAHKRKPTAGVVKDPNSVDCTAANVLYGTAASFAFIHLFSKREKQNPMYYNQRLFHIGSCPVIVDEVDSLLIDSTGNSALLSDAGKNSPCLLAIKEQICQTMLAIRQESTFNPDSMSEIAEVANEESTKTRAKEMARAREMELPLSEYEKIIFESSLTQWVDSCYEALHNLKQNVDYIIDPNDNKIKIVDSENTGEIQKDSRWTGGRHTFLEMKHGIFPGSDIPVCHSMSYFSLFKKYGNRLSGLTGTLGSPETRKFLKDTYNATMYESPRYVPTGLKIEPAIPTSMSPQAEIIKKCEEILRQNRPILLINKTIEECKQFAIILEDKLGIKFPDLKIVRYWDSLEDELETKLQDVTGNTIVVASNLAGRGTDIKISNELNANGGLAVIQGSLAENQRVDEQAQGRAGRCGQNGSSISIYQADTSCQKILLNIETKSPDRLDETREQIHKSHVNARDTKEIHMISSGKRRIDFQMALDDSYERFISLKTSYSKVFDNPSSHKTLSDYYGCERLKIENKYQDDLNSRLATLENSDEASKDKIYKELLNEAAKKFDVLARNLRSKCQNSTEGVLDHGVCPELLKQDRLGKEDDTIKRADAVLSQDPNNSLAHVIKATALYNQKKAQEAKEVLDKVTETETSKQILNKSLAESCKTMEIAAQSANMKPKIIEYQALNMELDQETAENESPLVLSQLSLEFSEPKITIDESFLDSIGNDTKLEIVAGPSSTKITESAAPAIKGTEAPRIPATVQNDKLPFVKKPESNKKVSNPKKEAMELKSTNLANEIQEGVKEMCLTAKSIITGTDEREELAKSKKSSKSNSKGAQTCIQIGEAIDTKAQESNFVFADAHIQELVGILYDSISKFEENPENHVQLVAGEFRTEAELKEMENQGIKENELDPDTWTLKPVKKTGYLGYIIGAIKIIGGCAVAYFTGNFMLAGDLICAGIEMCIENYQMNESGTYSHKKVIISALKKGARIALSANLGPVFDKLKSLKFLSGPNAQKMLTFVHEAQKVLFQHRSGVTMMMQRTNSLLNTVGVACQPTIVQSGKIAAIDSFNAFDAWECVGQLRLLGQQMEKQKKLDTAEKVRDDFKQHLDDNNVRKQMEYIHPDNIRRKQKLIVKGPGKKLADKICNQILDAISEKPGLATYSNLGDQIIENLKNTTSKTCSYPRLDKSLVGRLTESQIDSLNGDDLMINDRTRDGLQHLTKQLTGLKGELSNIEDLLPANLKALNQDTLAEALLEKSVANQEYENYKKAKQSGKSVPDEDKQIESIRAKLNAAGNKEIRSQIAIMCKDATFNQSWHSILNKHWKEALNFQPKVSYSKEQLILDMQASNDAVKEHCCHLIADVTIQTINRMYEFGAKLKESATDILPATSEEAEYLLIQKYRSELTSK